VEFGPFFAEFGVVDVVVVAIWHGCSLGVTAFVGLFGRLKPLFILGGALRGAEAPLFHVATFLGDGSGQ